MVFHLVFSGANREKRAVVERTRNKIDISDKNHRLAEIEREEIKKTTVEISIDDQRSHQNVDRQPIELDFFGFYFTRSSTTRDRDKPKSVFCLLCSFPHFVWWNCKVQRKICIEKCLTLYRSRFSNLTYFGCCFLLFFCWYRSQFSKWEKAVKIMANAKLIDRIHFVNNCDDNCCCSLVSVS